MLVLITTGAFAGNRRSVRLFLFGNRGHWILVNAQTLKSHPIDFPDPYEPVSATVSPGGRVIVFTAYDPAKKNVFMYRWNWRDHTVPRRIGDTRGYHSDPAISPDGQWIYFAHNPTARGGPMHHAPGGYAEIYRVHMDGSHLQALTSGQGCHYAPTVGTDGSIVIVHATCMGTSRLERLSGIHFSQKALPERGERYEEPELGSRGTLVYVVETTHTFEIHEHTRHGDRLRLSLPKRPERLRPRLRGIGDDIIYQHDGAVWRLHGESTLLVATYEENRQ